MKQIIYLLIAILSVVMACKPEHLAVPNEPLKAVSGTWQVIKATRNGTDLTSRFDFSKFRIHFTDSTYTIDNALPFLVSKSGTWTFDDPRYPFNLSFTATDSSAKTSPISFPVVGGQRNIIITFSPGCDLNSYQYTLQKVN
jgi:uncharacterized membrane protein